MNKYYRVSLIVLVSLQLIVLFCFSIFNNAESAQIDKPISKQHLSKSLSVYSASVFDEMLQEYCNKMDLKADYHGSLNPAPSRPGNHELPNYGRYVSWTIKPSKITHKKVPKILYNTDWFSICLSNEKRDSDEHQIEIEGQPIYIKISRTYGKYNKLSAKLPNNITVREFLSNLTEYSKNYRTLNQRIKDSFDRLPK